MIERPAPAQDGNTHPARQVLLERTRLAAILHNYQQQASWTADDEAAMANLYIAMEKLDITDKSTTTPASLNGLEWKWEYIKFKTKRRMDRILFGT